LLEEIDSDRLFTKNKKCDRPIITNHQTAIAYSSKAKQGDRPSKKSIKQRSPQGLCILIKCKNTPCYTR
jgi:hypothetical protein